MKQLSVFAVGALALMCACGSKTSNEYTINGTTDLADGEVLTLVYQLEDSTVTDTIHVAGGVFTASGTLERPLAAYIVYGEPGYNNEKMRQFMLEPGTLTIALTGESYRGAEITGSPLTQEMDSVTGVQMSIYDQMMPLRGQFAEAQGDSAKMAELQQQYMALNDQLQQVIVDFVKQHPASFYSAVLMPQVRSSVGLDELKEIYGALSPEVQAADKATATYISALESIQPGAVAPEIKGKDQNDNEVSLSGLKGKVVLVDFWATWCGPCRASLPHVKELYDKYHDKGLEVLAISLDRDPQPWKEYIANSGMGMENYVNIYDQPVNNADNYAIQYIPSKFIVDREGNMVGRFDDGEELEAKLAELLAE